MGSAKRDKDLGEFNKKEAQARLILLESLAPFNTLPDKI